jgi:hypothetical protein
MMAWEGVSSFSWKLFCESKILSSLLISACNGSRCFQRNNNLKKVILYVLYNTVIAVINVGL